MRCRSTHGACLNDRERQDPLLLHLFAIIDNAMRAHETATTAAAMSSQLAARLLNG